MRRTKPKGAYIGKEWQFQITAVELIYQLFNNCLLIHVENEGKKSEQAGAIAKKMGKREGVSDILIFNSNSHFKGLAIELKIWPRKPTPAQLDFMKELEGCGWLCEVCYGLDEVQKIVKEYRK